MPTLPDPQAPIFEEEVPSPVAPIARPAAAAPRTAYLALLLGNVALALGPWFVRLSDIGPVASGFWRLALATPFLILVAARSERSAPRPSMGLIAALLIAGITFALDLGSWHAGILRTQLANATLFGNVSSFFFMAYGFLIARAWPAPRQAAALLLAGAGTALLLGRSYELSADHLVGDLLCVLAGLAYAAYMVVIDRIRGQLGNWTVLAAATGIAAITLLPMAIALDGQVWPHLWWPLLALAIGSQVIGQGLLIYTIRLLPPMMIGLGQLSQPIVAAAIGWIIFHEHLALPDLAGAAAIIVALILARRA